MQESSTHGINRASRNVTNMFKTYEKTLRQYAQSISQDEHVIDDAIQELFLRFCEKPELTKTINNVEAYLKISVRRLILQKKKELKGVADVGRLVEIAVPSYEDFLIKQQNDNNAALNMRAGLDQLSSQQKTILTLRFFRGMSYDTIAEKLGISRRTVYNQIHRAVKKLRQALSK